MSISEKNPKLAKLAGQFIKFYAFSMLVTLLQYLLLTFLPGLFYTHTDWCSIPCQLIHLNLGPVDTYVFNYPVTGDATGGMGYFAAFAITLFLAQCVNFPMQRNITFKSKGNIWYQILWYVIAFVLITIVCSFLMGLYVPLCKQFFSPAVYNVLITVINGGVQMVIYFPIYKIIFPKESRDKIEKMKLCFQDLLKVITTAQALITGADTEEAQGEDETHTTT